MKYICKEIEPCVLNIRRLGRHPGLDEHLAYIECRDSDGFFAVRDALNKGGIKFIVDNLLKNEENY